VVVQIDYAEFARVVNDCWSVAEAIRRTFSPSRVVFYERRKEARRRGFPTKRFQRTYQPRVSHEEFTRIWNASASYAEVCQATGMKLEAVKQRRQVLRKRGVELKAYQHRPTTLREFFFERIRLDGDCWTWTGALLRGRPTMNTLVDGRPRTMAPRRFCWEFHKGAVPPRMNVVPTCGNKLCVAPNHLAPVRPTSNFDNGSY
jgi:hypothetical protein